MFQQLGLYLTFVNNGSIKTIKSLCLEKQIAVD